MRPRSRTNVSAESSCHGEPPCFATLSQRSHPLGKGDRLDADLHIRRIAGVTVVLRDFDRVIR